MASTKTLRLRAEMAAENARIAALGTLDPHYAALRAQRLKVTAPVPSRYARSSEYRVTEIYGGEE